MVTRHKQAVGSLFRVALGNFAMNDERRPFGFWTTTALVVGGMIGAGIFVLPSQMARFGWTGMVAWIIGGASALIIARVLSAVAEARPNEPGLIAVIGEVLGPVLGVLVGWGAWVGCWVSNAYLALTAVRYAGSIWPLLIESPTRQALYASAIIAILTALNLASLRGSGRFQVVMTILKLLPLAAVLLILAWLTAQGGAAFTMQQHPPFALSDLFAAITLVFVAIVGFESASIAASRVRNPKQNISRATMIGVALTCVIYIAVCSGIVFVLPQSQVAASTAPVALFVSQFLGGWAGDAVALFAVISVVGCLGVWILMQSEIPLALVRARLLPEWVGRTNKHDIAAAPLVIGSSLTVVLLLLASWRSGAALMDFMLNLTAVTSVWLYAFACMTALKLHVRRGFAVFGLLFCLGIFYGAGAEPVLLSISLLLAALPLYWIARRSLVSSAKSSATTAGPTG